MKYFNHYLAQYFEFRGRASRSEYIYFNLFVLLVQLALLIFFGLVEFATLTLRETDEHLPFTLWFMACTFIVLLIVVYIPQLMLTIRRMHDFNVSGWWLIPIIGVGYVMVEWLEWYEVVPALMFLAFILTKGSFKKNRFGDKAELEVDWSETVFGSFWRLPAYTRYPLIAAVFGLVYLAFFVPVQGTRPVVSEHGQTKYTLLDRRTETPLVLQLPTDLQVFRPEVDYIGMPGLGGMRTGYDANRWLSFVLNLPNLDPVTSLNAQIADNQVEIRVLGTLVSQNDSRIHSDLREACTIGSELSPGVFEIVEKTIEQARPLFANRVRDDQSLDDFYQERIKDRCNRRFDGMREVLALYDTERVFVGTGYCNDRFERSCHFILWVPLNREVRIFFDDTQLESLQEIYGELLNYLEQASEDI